MDWDKVLTCPHKNTTDYYEDVFCGTPYCSGYEYHCKDCGAFITECSCKTMSGVSGWSSKRWKAHWNRHFATKPQPPVQPMGR